MKALVLHAVGDLRIEEVPTPTPGSGEVLVRVAFCGVCGSDIPRVFSKGTYHFPTIPGHEFAGTVAAWGDGVTDLVVGQGVEVFPLLWCGRCVACEVGEYARCEDYGYLGSRNDGGFAEYVVAPRRNLLPLPAGVGLDAAAMTEPAAVALHALRRVGESLVGQSVAVFGAGPIGLMVGQWARIMGASRVTMLDVAPEKLDVAKALGFEAVSSSVASIDADVAVDAAGAPSSLLAAAESVNAAGTVVMLGNPTRDFVLPPAVWSQLMRREAKLVGTWNSQYRQFGEHDDWHITLEAIASGQLNVLSLVTHRVPLSEGLTALETMRDQPATVGKILLQP